MEDFSKEKIRDSEILLNTSTSPQSYPYSYFNSLYENEN